MRLESVILMELVKPKMKNVLKHSTKNVLVKNVFELDLKCKIKHWAGLHLELSYIFFGLQGW